MGYSIYNLLYEYVWLYVFANLFEAAWHTEEFVDGIDGYKQHGGQGYGPAHNIWPVRESIFIISQVAGGNNAGDHHKLHRK